MKATTPTLSTVNRFARTHPAVPPPTMMYLFPSVPILKLTPSERGIIIVGVHLIVSTDCMSKYDKATKGRVQTKKVEHVINLRNTVHCIPMPNLSLPHKPAAKTPRRGALLSPAVTDSRSYNNTYRRSPVR